MSERDPIPCFVIESFEGFLALSTVGWIGVGLGGVCFVIFVLAIWFYPRDNSF